MNMLQFLTYSKPVFNVFTLAFRRSYATPAKSSVAAKIMAAQPAEDQAFIDMDTEKLTKNCCCNYLKEGTDIPLKADSEYPTWLFNMRLNPVPTLDELDPNEMAYWKRYDDFSIRERLERRKHFYGSTYAQHWLTDVKKIPMEEIQGDVEHLEKEYGLRK